MSEIDDEVFREMEKKFAAYRERFGDPTDETKAKWRRQAVKKINIQKFQLKFDFMQSESEGE